jgi:hypothetical protein
MRRKLGLETAAELVRFAIEAKLGQHGRSFDR